MKKLVLSFIALSFVLSSLVAQDPGASYKSAKKAMSSYYNQTDSDKKNAKLREAKTKIDEAISGIDQIDKKKKTKAWLLSGEIHNEISDKFYKASILNPEAKPEHPKSAFTALKSYKAAREIASKKWEKKEALDALMKTATYLSNDGIIAYTTQDFASAFESFNAVLDVRDVLSANSHDLILPTDQEYHEQLFRTALSAQLAKKLDSAKTLYQKLIDVDYQESGIYGGLHLILKEEDKKDESLTILNKGREKFPEDENLRIYEINYYLSEGRLDELVGKLETAIVSDPKNLSLYSTLGHVFDNLHQREAEAKNAEKSKEYFNKALKYYDDALKIDGNYGPALYNTGALYYNAAAQVTREMVALEDDYSAAGTRKYEAKKSEMMALFDNALPYFQKSEALNPSDIGTLSALREIYARKDDLEKTNEFKVRMEKVQNGEEITKSYF